MRGPFVEKFVHVRVVSPYRSNFDSTPPPILIDAGVAVLENEKIERHIMKNVPGGHNLFVQVSVFPRSYSRF